MGSDIHLNKMATLREKSEIRLTLLAKMADELQKKNVALMRAKNELKKINQQLEDAFNDAIHSKKCIHEACKTILSNSEYIDLTHDSDYEEVLPVEYCPVRSNNVAPSANYDGQVLLNVDCSRWVSREEPNLECYMNEHSDTPNHFVKDEGQVSMTDVKNFDPHQQVFSSLFNPLNDQDNEALKEIEKYLKSDSECPTSTKDTFQNASEDDTSQPAISDSEAVVLVDDLTWKPNTVILSNQDANSPDSGYDSEDRTDSPSLPSSPTINQNEVLVEETEASANNNLNSVFVSNAHEEMTQLKEEARRKHIPSSVSLSSKDDPSLHLIPKQGNLFYTKNEDIEATKMTLQMCELHDLNLSRMICGTDNMVVFGEPGCSPDLGFDSDGCSDISSSPPDWQMNRGNSKYQKVVFKPNAFLNTNYVLMTGNSSDIKILNCNSKYRIGQARSIPIPEKNYRKRSSNVSMVRTQEKNNKVTRRECFKRCTVLSENSGDKTDNKHVTSLPVSNDNINNNYSHKEDVSNVSDTLQKLTLTENNSASNSDENSNSQVKNGTKESNDRTVVTIAPKTNKNSFVDTVLEKDLNNLQTTSTDSNNNRAITTNTTAENNNSEIYKQVGPSEVKGYSVNSTNNKCVLEITSQKQTSESSMERVKNLYKKTGGHSRNACDDSNISDEVSDVGNKIKNLSLK